MVLHEYISLCFPHKEHDCPGARAYTFSQNSGKYVTWRVIRAQYLVILHI
jgi:hypothetical protein